jgi:hypothetical protein
VILRYRADSSSTSRPASMAVVVDGSGVEDDPPNVSVNWKVPFSVGDEKS